MITKDEILQLLSRQYEISNYDYAYAFGNGVISAASKILSAAEIVDLHIYNDQLFDMQFEIID